MQKNTKKTEILSLKTMKLIDQTPAPQKETVKRFVFKAQDKTLQLKLTCMVRFNLLCTRRLNANTQKVGTFSLKFC